MEFDGRKVVITGAAGVYGRQFAKAFADEGARLCLSDRRGDAAERLRRELRLDDRTLVHPTELSELASIADLVALVGRAWGAPDVVVNNAAIYPFDDLLTLDPGSWDEVMDVNLRAPFVLMQAFGRAMVEKGVKGSFVNIGSSSGQILRTNGVPYCVSKRGLDWLTKGFALALGAHGIRVNLVEPAFNAGSEVVALPADHAGSIAGAIPLKRLAGPDEVPRAVLFLASDRASYITGATLAVNGGDSVSRRPDPSG